MNKKIWLRDQEKCTRNNVQLEVIGEIRSTELEAHPLMVLNFLGVPGKF
jgi:hypothetical protein